MSKTWYLGQKYSRKSSSTCEKILQVTPMKAFNVLLAPSLSLDIVYHANFNKTNVRNVKCNSGSSAVLTQK